MRGGCGAVRALANMATNSRRERRLRTPVLVASLMLAGWGRVGMDRIDSDADPAAAARPSRRDSSTVGVEERVEQLCFMRTVPLVQSSRGTFPVRQWASICSRVLPFVSGTSR